MFEKKTGKTHGEEIIEAVKETIAPADDNHTWGLEKTSNNEKLQIVSFFLDTFEYALEVTDAVEVLKPAPLTAVPRTPDFIKGILSVRGEVVPVIDLKKRLGRGFSGDNKGRILITAIHDLKAGFIVDRMSGIQEIPVNSVDSAIEFESTLPWSFLKGIIRLKNRNIGLLDLGRLIDLSVA